MIDFIVGGTDFFFKIINMSIAAGWAVVAVILMRLLLKKAPRWICVLAWGIVALRLICPFTIESMLSIIPSAQTVSPDVMLDRTPAIDSGVPIINDALNPVIQSSFAPAPADSANPLQVLIPMLYCVWLVGIAVMVTYTVVSYAMLKLKLRTAVRLYDNIYQSERVATPFVLGIIAPRIYLPFDISEGGIDHVIAHEKAHISRRDHLLKPLGFLLLCVHWFNPLVWLGYILFCRDIEVACDEKVVRSLDIDGRADYSQALLECSVRRHSITACPIAFGEVGVKNRIKSVLSYKRPALWLIIAAVLLCAVAAVCLATDPSTTLDTELSVFIDMQVAEHNRAKDDSDNNFVVTSHKILGVSRLFGKTKVYMWSLYNEYSYKNGMIINEQSSYIPTVITAKRVGAHRHYELVEYWTPRDAPHYADDIKKKFPWHLQSKALDPTRYIDKQQEFCLKSAEQYFAPAPLADDIEYTETYKKTAYDDIQTAYDNGQFVISATHYKTADGDWVCGGRRYRYRLEISGTMNNAAKSTTYIVLSNVTGITFDMTWKASGLSSNMDDYFSPQDAVIVGHKLF